MTSSDLFSSKACQTRLKKHLIKLHHWIATFLQDCICISSFQAETKSKITWACKRITSFHIVLSDKSLIINDEPGWKDSWFPEHKSYLRWQGQLFLVWTWDVKRTRKANCLIDYIHRSILPETRFFRLYPITIKRKVIWCTYSISQ